MLLPLLLGHNGPAKETQKHSDLDIKAIITSNLLLVNKKGPTHIPIAQAVRNFVQLCLEGYYDGIIFHRVIKDFMAQTGDPTGTGDGALITLLLLCCCCATLRCCQQDRTSQIACCRICNKISACFILSALQYWRQWVLPPSLLLASHSCVQVVSVCTAHHSKMSSTVDSSSITAAWWLAQMPMRRTPMAANSSSPWTSAYGCAYMCVVFACECT